MISDSTLDITRDPMGAAILDYNVSKDKKLKIRVFSSLFDEDEMMVSYLFRTYNQMSEIERTAINLAQGKILDVGACAGCHSLEMIKMGKDVTAIDISPNAINVLRERGVENSLCINLFDKHLNSKYNTILMLMNGSGIIGKIDNLPQFFERISELLEPEGVVYLDSSDLRYLFEEEDGSITINLADDYYGEVDFSMQFKDVKGESFDWLYIDFDTLQMYAEKCGFTATLITKGEHYDYLAKLTKANS